MGDDEEHKLGVKNAQRGGFLDDFCQSLVNTGSAYDKGYEYGVDHRYDSSGERYHTWGNQGKNDSKSDNSSSDSGSVGSFGKGFWTGYNMFGGSKVEGLSSSGGGYSGGGGGSYSGGGGGSGGGEAKGCLGCLGIIGIGVLGLFLGNGLLSEIKPSKNQEQSITQMSLEDNVRRLSDYIRNTNQLDGNFEDYKLIPPRKLENSENDYELGFVSFHSFYVFHSSDNGRTWAPQPPLSPYFIKLVQDYNNSIGRDMELGDAPRADPPIQFVCPPVSASLGISKNNFGKSDLGKIINEDNYRYGSTETTSTSFDYSIPNVRLDSEIIDSIQRFIEPSDVIDLHDGSIAVRLGKGLYYKVDSYKLDELNRIYENYCRLAQNSPPNRYRSYKMLENSIKKNLKTELRRVVIRCEKIEEDYILAMK